MIRARVLGAAFLSLLLIGVYLTYAIFTKKFSDYEEVTLQTSSIGLQLPDRADVKIRGVIVGEVLDFTTDGDGANVTLGIYPDEIDTIPSDVTGAILPKTLFGEKYVSLEIPSGSAATGSDHLEAGAVISRTQVSTEVENVLKDLYPLLRTVEPAQLNYTLTALANALEGRGEQLGQNLETVDAYLKQFNPLLPQLIDDLRQTATVSAVYADVLPQVGQILRDQVTTLGTLRDRGDKLEALYRDVTAFAGTGRQFLIDNGDNMIALAKVSAPQLDVLARYSTEFPCLLRGIVNAGALQAEAFRGFTLHIVLETLPNQPRAYTVQDRPVFGDDRGPTCLHLPNPPWSQKNPLTTQPNFRDGIDEPTGKGTRRVTPSYWLRDGMSGFVGSDAESALLKSLLAPGMGVSADQVSDLGPLLVGPMARGAKVSLR